MNRVFFCWVLVAASAWGQDFLEPGTMGPNALPPLALESATLHDGWTLRFGSGVQLSRPNGGGFDLSTTLPMRFDMSLGGYAMLITEGTPIETWWVSRATQSAWGTRQGFGANQADLRIGAKFRLLKGNDRRPSLALRVFTKTTTGKEMRLHRFINAPGYSFEFLVGHPVWKFASGVLEVTAAVGFWAWQLDSNRQNDTFHYSARAAFHFNSGMQGSLETRGYVGWRTDDKPWVWAAGGEFAIAKHAFLVTELLWSVRDPVGFSAMLGVRITSFDLPTQIL